MLTCVITMAHIYTHANTQQRSKKDEALKETSSIGRAMPPVRNTASPADGAGAAPAKKKEPAAPKQKAIPGGDFRAWDKFVRCYFLEKKLEEEKEKYL